MTSLELLWKATAILVAAFAASRWMRRSPAAMRHFVWTAAFAILLFLPAASLLSPKWTPPVVAAPVAAAQITVHPTAVPGASVQKAASSISLATLWWIGFALVAARFLAGTGRTAWIAARAQRVGAEQGVRVVESADAPMAMTWGIFRPVIILPLQASEWDAERRRVVLLHELTHVRRHDLLAQAIAQAASCLYWFHPLAWTALRELRKERERACDDGVLSTGIPAHQYASHVMELARSLAERRGSFADAPAMADTSDLESRIRAMLDRGRNRRPLHLRAALGITAVALAALLPLASVTALAQGARGNLTGTVSDPSDARIANAVVRATNLEGSNRETTTANAAGEYQFVGIPAGRYALEFAVPGFKLGKKEATLVAGATARLDAMLEIGTVAETLLIRSGDAPRPARIATRAPEARRIRVGGDIQQVRMVQHVKPVYPPDAQQAGVEGVVMLTAIINKNGTVGSVAVENTVDERLAKAAMDAVRQWVYTPALLNGQPVEVLTKIDLKFQLGQ